MSQSMCLRSRTFPSRIFIAVALPVLLMGGVACGGASGPPAGEDKAWATAIVLKASDLPGFEVYEDEDDDGDGGVQACLKDNPTWSVRPNPRGADSSFANDDVVVASGALLTVKEPEARKAFADVKAAASSQCLRDEFRASVLENAPPCMTIGEVSTVSLPAPGLGDESTAARITMEIAARGQREKLHLDMTFIRHGRTVSGLMASRQGTPFADDERIRLSTVMANRMNGKADEVAQVPVTSPPTTAASPPTTVTSPSTTAPSTTKWTTYRDSSG